jgi:hypothetical protein
MNPIIQAAKEKLCTHILYSAINGLSEEESANKMLNLIDGSDIPREIWLDAMKSFKEDHNM